MEKLKYQIVTLGNGNKYFVYDEYKENDNKYNLLINVDDESDVEIVKQEMVDSKLILKELNNPSEIVRLSKIFENNKNKENK